MSILIIIIAMMVVLFLLIWAIDYARIGAPLAGFLKAALCIIFAVWLLGELGIVPGARLR